jgi:hypothetical protein
MVWVAVPKNSDLWETLNEKTPTVPYVNHVNAQGEEDSANLGVLNLNEEELNRIQTNYIVYSYNLNIKGNEFPIVLPKNKFSYFGPDITWPPGVLKKVISIFLESLSVKYEGFGFCQAHGSGSLVGSGTFLAVHSFSSFETEDFVQFEKIFDYDIINKYPEISEGLYCNIGVPIYDSNKIKIGVFIPPGDLVCFWDVTHYYNEDVVDIFIKFLNASVPIINKYKDGFVDNSNLSIVVKNTYHNKVSSLLQGYHRELESHLNNTRTHAELSFIEDHARNIIKNEKEKLNTLVGKTIKSFKFDMGFLEFVIPSKQIDLGEYTYMSPEETVSINYITPYSSPGSFITITPGGHPYVIKTKNTSAFSNVLFLGNITNAIIDNVSYFKLYDAVVLLVEFLENISKNPISNNLVQNFIKEHKNENNNETQA